MFTGWPMPTRYYKLNRPLTDQEVEERLEVQYGSTVPMQSQLVLRLNGTFLEVADRSQHHRGGLMLLFATLVLLSAGLIFPIGLFAYLWGGEIFPYDSGLGKDATLFNFLFSIALIGSFVWFGFYKLFWPTIKFNLASYRYYPIRFNRKNRQVYIFTRDGEVKKLPFDKIFWHIGHGGGRDEYLTDIRGHEIDEKGIIRYTFNAGPYFGLNQEYMTLDNWHFICRYMTRGEAAVVSNPYDRVIVENYKDVSWTSSFHFQYMRTYPVIWKPLMPLHLLTAAFHLLCMKFSKQPEWPEWVEKECALDPNDPPPWPEPEHFADPMLNNPDPEYLIYGFNRVGHPEEAAKVRRNVEQGIFQQELEKPLNWKAVMIRFALYVAVFFAGVYLYDWFYG